MTQSIYDEITMNATLMGTSIQEKTGNEVNVYSVVIARGNRRLQMMYERNLFTPGKIEKCEVLQVLIERYHFLVNYIPHSSFTPNVVTTSEASRILQVVDVDEIAELFEDVEFYCEM